MPAPKGNQFAKGNKGGAPTKYNSDILKKTKKYIDSCEDEEYQLIKTDGDKSTSFENKIRVKLPTIEGLALYLETNRDNIYEWEKEHAEFSDILKKLRAKQASKLIENGLSGDYNPLISKLILSKHGYVEKSEVDSHHTGEVSFINDLPRPKK